MRRDRLSWHRPGHTDEIVSLRLTVLGRHEHERFFRFGWWLPEHIGDFSSEGNSGYFWSASAYGSYAWYRILNGGSTEVSRATTTNDTVFQFVAFGIKNAGLWGA